MPYYVYAIAPPRRLSLLGTFESYREAKALARSKRAEPDAGDPATVRLVFAPDADEAQRLLTEVREPRPMGEE